MGNLGHHLPDQTIGNISSHSLIECHTTECQNSNIIARYLP
jgi:hypothetical protein